LYCIVCGEGATNNRVNNSFLGFLLEIKLMNDQASPKNKTDLNS